ncbi:uncharacterized protein NECHADRAFT_100020 [Fusarium vanettenii 77-13-4]|uniref:Uncharacterized protein n=1 Tax=Fusarium vanettenii (strain ATCC MYA-4622 / CBS 123669 / FGSC 9596 / NRRL 45880 / 77-13-4) TaxID=660122 RepID=C7YQ17_FUSV7|nr:uncharacterized protein NECHADRAFT_100020 [Fusarium vanettenii 77-13-4]EEU45947.1 hypothetical protein NECHADRAFT_100020 [Fusarium vanettenii 77-13-4]
MPKRIREPQDTGEKTQPPVRRATERSHSENQERAYIAASRRADRSIEARVQSARNASEIHKKRTGKAFRITEEIVMKEEMYEEEDDEFPRSYRLLNPHMQTANPELNARVDAYLSNKVAMSTLITATENDWRNNEINTTFDQFFPNVQSRARAASQWSTSQGFLPQTLHSPVATPRVLSVGEQHFNMQFHPVNYGHPNNGQQNNGKPNNGQQNNGQPKSRQPSSGQQNNGQQNNERHLSTASLPVSPTEDRNNVPMSPPALTPGSMSHPETPRSRHGSAFVATQSQSYNTRGFDSESSSFTSQLPPEARMFLGGVGLGNPYGPMYHEPQMWPAQSFSLDAGADPTQFFGYTPDTKPLKEGETTEASGGEQYPDPFTIMNWNGQNESDSPAQNVSWNNQGDSQRESDSPAKKTGLNNQGDNQGDKQDESDSQAKNVLEEWETYIDDSAFSSSQK